MNPADRTPRHHERRGVEDDEHQRRDADGVGERQRREGRHADHHARGPDDEQRLAAHLVNGEDRHDGEDDVDDAHDDGLKHRGVARSAHVLEDARGVVEHDVDADGLLEERQQDADQDHGRAVGEELFALFVHRGLDVVEDRACLGRAVDAFEHGESLGVAAPQGEEPRGFGHEHDQQEEGARRESLGEEHPPPADLDHGGLDGFARVAEVVADQVVDEIDDQHAEDDGELIARDERAADLRRGDLGDVHRADGRGQSDADSADDAVDVERHQQRKRSLAVGEDAALGPPRTDGRDEEEHRRHDERTFAPEARGQQPRDRTADDAADQRARSGEAVHPRRVGEVRGAPEELVEGLFGARHDGRVVTEEQSADDRHQNDGEEVGAAAGLLV